MDCLDHTADSLGPAESLFHAFVMTLRFGVAVVSAWFARLSPNVAISARHEE